MQPLYHSVTFLQYTTSVLVT